VIALVKIAISLIADAGRFVMLSLCSRRSLAAEVLFLRRQLALCKERGTKLRRIDPATRVSLVVLAKLCNWREALIVLRPETLVRRKRHAKAALTAASQIS
jgi:putative transposase